MTMDLDVTIQPAAIEAMQDLIGETHTRLVPMYFEAKSDAIAFADSVDIEPSFVLARGDERVLYWALTCGVDEEAFPTTGAFSFPMPGQDGWTFATEDYHQDAATGSFPVYEPEQVALLAEIVVPPAETEDVEVPFDDPAYAEAVVTGAPPVAEAAPPVQGVTSSFQDATVHGELDPASLALPMVHGYSADGRRSDNWENVPVSIGQFISGLTQHKVGTKDGPSILQGSVINGLRTKKSMEAMQAIAIDVDNGTRVSTILDRVRALGKLAVVYTTHSHMSTKTARSQDDFVKWAKKSGVDATPTDATLARYLKEVRGIVPEIADTVRYVATTHTDKGLQIVGEHAPMPKFRVILPLAAPYVFADRGGSHMEAIRVWGEKILGLGELLHVAVDESCTDPSRLFYLPRHDEGRPFEIHVVAGELISIEDVPAIQKRRKIIDPFLAMAEDMGARGGNALMTPGGVDLIRWSKERGEGFEIGAVFDMYAPERIRARNGTKLAVECPFDGEHSNPGDTEDQGCFVCDASQNEQQSGFAFKCMHSSCAERSRIDMASEAIRLGWFDEGVLTDEDFNSTLDALPSLVAPEQEIDHEGSLKALRDRIADFTANTSPRDIEMVLTAAVQADASAVQMDDIVDRIIKRTKIKKGAISEDLKRIRRKIRSSRTEAENLAALGVTPRPGTVALLIDSMDEYELLDRSKEILIDGNYKTPRVFSYNCQPYRCTIRPETQELSLQSVDDRILRHELTLHTTYFEQRGENSARGVLPPMHVVQMVLADTEFRLPTLAGFARMPYLSKDGKMVERPGWDRDTGYMLTINQSVSIPPIPETPTLRDAQVAQARLRDVFSDFPFDDGETTVEGEEGQSSWAHFLAALLELYVRPRISGPTPIFAVTKPSPGTGGSLAVESLVQIATGAKPPILGQMNQDDDIRKMITSIFMRGQTVFVYDNIPDRSPVSSTHWANLASASVWSDRQLGGNETIEAPNRVLKIFIGNNTRYSHEIARRCAPIRLDAKVSPLSRTDFKIPDFEVFIERNKGLLAACCMTIVKYWASIGMPEDTTTKPLVTFEGWTRVMGGILNSIGVAGFLRNLPLIQVAANDEKMEWESFIADWYAKPDFAKPNPVTNPDGDELSLARPFVDAENISLPGVYGKNSAQLVASLRKALATKIDNVFTVPAPTSYGSVEEMHQVRIRSTRGERGGRAFYLERVYDAPK